MDERIKFFVGLDAHKDTISIAALKLAGSRLASWARSGRTCKGCSRRLPRPAIRHA